MNDDPVLRSGHPVHPVHSCLRSAIGIDLGSRLTKVVRLEAPAPKSEISDLRSEIPSLASQIRLSHSAVFETGHASMDEVERAIQGMRSAECGVRPGPGASDPTPQTPDPASIVATGYGRRQAQERWGAQVVTEIRACARAARFLCPEATGVIDVGGQDAKAVELGRDGAAARFEMNDRCAAGTGRFLEVMAAALGFSLDDFGPEALRADRPVLVSSMCTVFAESEVVSLLARGEDRRRIALGLIESIARRVAAMAARVDLGSRVLFVGGVARNSAVVRALAAECGMEPLAGLVGMPHSGFRMPHLAVPPQPELAVALGAALIGLDDQPD
jgi:predicted CoA-substrate-specific enzyme activase